MRRHNVVNTIVICIIFFFIASSCVSIELQSDWLQQEVVVDEFMEGGDLDRALEFNTELIQKFIVTYITCLVVHVVELGSQLNITHVLKFWKRFFILFDIHYLSFISQGAA